MGNRIRSHFFSILVFLAKSQYRCKISPINIILISPINFTQIPQIDISSLMAVTTDLPRKFETHFTKLDEQKTLLTNCTDLYKTLTNHFTTLHNSIELKSQTLDSKLQTLDSTLTDTLDSINQREESIPELLTSLSETVESRKIAALYEVSTPGLDEYAPIAETLKSVCRRMDPELLDKLFVGKRRQSKALRGMMSDALSECVDSARFVIEAVREFVAMKREKRDGLSDKRLACTMVVGGMFAPDDLKAGAVKTRELGRVFSKRAVERAEAVLREWREVGENLVKECGGEGSGMGPSESAMFIEMALGFGLKEKFGDEFLRKLMVEFCERRDMAKLAIPVFGDKVADFIEELVKTGKEVEAVYFAFESGLTERFQPASLLKSASRKSKIDTADILKKGHHSPVATDEANSMEMTSIKAIIKCVEDLKIEEQYPIENLKKRLDALLQAKADRKKGATAGYSKRSHNSGAQARPPKFQKHSSPSATGTSPVSRYLGPTPSTTGTSPVSRYLGPTPYTYPSQSTCAAELAAPAYAPSYSGSHIPASGIDQVSQRYYSAPGVNGASTGGRFSIYYGSQDGYASDNYGGVTAPVSTGGSFSGYYGSQDGYASYDYGDVTACATTPSYPPPSYPR